MSFIIEHDTSKNLIRFMKDVYLPEPLNKRPTITWKIADPTAIALDFRCPDGTYVSFKGNEITNVSVVPDPFDLNSNHIVLKFSFNYPDTSPIKTHLVKNNMAYISIAPTSSLLVDANI